MNHPIALQRRMVSGVEAVQAVRRLKQLQSQRDEWPYPWSFPPPNAIRVKATGSIAAPTPTVQAVVVSYTVPTGFMFYLTRLVQAYTGAGLVPGCGDATWTLDKNVPLGYPYLQGSVVQGFSADTVPLGDFILPWVLDTPEVLEAGDTARSKVLTTVNITAGDPNWFTSVLLGWLVPAE